MERRWNIHRRHRRHRNIKCAVCPLITWHNVTRFQQPSCLKFERIVLLDQLKLVPPIENMAWRSRYCQRGQNIYTSKKQQLEITICVITKPSYVIQITFSCRKLHINKIVFEGCMGLRQHKTMYINFNIIQLSVDIRTSGFHRNPRPPFVRQT